MLRLLSAASSRLPRSLYTRTMSAIPKTLPGQVSGPICLSAIG